MENGKLKTSGVSFRTISFAASILVAAIAWGCSHRGDGELNVDRIQGYANAIEKNVRLVRSALAKRDLQEADDRLEEAEEILSDNRKEMEAYPEIGQLEDSVSNTGTDVCFGHVSVALDKYFEYLHAKNPDDADEMLQLARKEHERCKDDMSSRPEYLALKMNLDTAPEYLDKLKMELARPALLEKIQQAKKPLEDLRIKIMNGLKSLEAKPDHRDLAVRIYSLLKKLAGELDSLDDFPDNPEWKSYKKKLHVDIDSMTRKRQALVRRGKVLMVVNGNLPEAEKNLKESLKLRRKDKARSQALLKGVREEFRRCWNVLKKQSKEEPSLKKYYFLYRGKKRNVSWLIRHIRARLAAVAMLLKQPQGRASSKSKKKQKRRHRIKRW